MRELGLKSKVGRAFQPTPTRVDPAPRPAENLLAQDFAASAPHRKWVATSASIGAGVRQPGQPYQVEVLFAKVVSSDPSTYPGVPVYGGYVSDTVAAVTTVPEPAAGLILGIGSLVLTARRRPAA